MRAARDHGAAFVGANVLRLDAGTREHFLKVLATEYPRLVDGYERLFAGGSRTVPRDYAEAVDATVADVRAMLDMRERAVS